MNLQQALAEADRAREFDDSVLRDSFRALIVLADEVKRQSSIVVDNTQRIRWGSNGSREIAIFCQKCMDSHAKGAVCVAELEAAVLEAAIHRRKFELQFGEVLWERDDDLEKAVDALNAACEK